MSEPTGSATAVLGGETPPPAPPAVQPAGGGPPVPASDHWTSSIEDTDLRGWAQNKGFADPTAVLTAYRNLEKLQGLPPERMLKLPKDDDPAAWGEVWGRLGRPETPEGYKIPALEGGEEFAKATAQWFHEAGLTVKQAEAIATKWNEYQSGVVKTYEDQSTLAATQALEKLKGAWGQAFDQNARIVDRTAEVFGMTEDHLLGLKAALGAGGAMEFLYNIGMRLGEDKFVTGEAPGSFVMTPEGARAKIAELSKDREFFKRLQAREVQATAEWERLHKQAAGPGMQEAPSPGAPGMPPVAARI